MFPDFGGKEMHRRNVSIEQGGRKKNLTVEWNCFSARMLIRHVRGRSQVCQTLIGFKWMAFSAAGAGGLSPVKDNFCGKSPTPGRKRQRAMNGWLRSCQNFNVRDRLEKKCDCHRRLRPAYERHLSVWTFITRMGR